MGCCESIDEEEAERRRLLHREHSVQGSDTRSNNSRHSSRHASVADYGRLQGRTESLARVLYLPSVCPRC